MQLELPPRAFYFNTYLNNTDKRSTWQAPRDSWAGIFLAAFFMHIADSICHDAGLPPSPRSRMAFLAMKCQSCVTACLSCMVSCHLCSDCFEAPHSVIVTMQTSSEEAKEGTTETVTVMLLLDCMVIAVVDWTRSVSHWLLLKTFSVHELFLKSAGLV